MNTNTRTQIEEFSARIGADPMLIQGAGGNVSWKADDTLWIKASGTWLADARDKDIFVPVDLRHLRSELLACRFDAAPVVQHGSAMRPSIETMLHALMPHTVVVHVHAVNALALLVTQNPGPALTAALPAALGPWALVPYKKPGAELAQALSDALASNQRASVIFLQNHGVVVGGDSVQQVEALLLTLNSALQASTRQLAPTASCLPPSMQLLTQAGYEPLAHADAPHALARDATMYDQVCQHWALYPDHVVFLGPTSACATNESQALVLARGAAKPLLLFLRGVGVFGSQPLTEAQRQQLDCYFHVLNRVPTNARLRSLTDAEIGDLLNWDAEKFRAHLSR